MEAGVSSALVPSHRAAGSRPVHMNGEARTARLSRVGGTATPPLTTVLARAPTGQRSHC